MNEKTVKKQYDLEERTYKFTRVVIELTGVLPKTLSNVEVIKQLVRSAGSVGANYIEANEAVSKKDFCFRVKICRKEAKESRYWLKLLEVPGEAIKEKQLLLIDEATELMKIFGAIVEKVK